MRENTAKIKFIIAMVIFGTIGLIVRYIPLSSAMVAFARGLVGTIFLGILVCVKKEKISWNAIKRNLRCLCISGVFLGLNWIFLFESYRYTTVATATLCYYLAPVFVILVSPLLLKEKLTLGKGLCALVALFGMVLVSGVLQGGVQGAQDVRGIFFGIAAAVLYAGIMILNKHMKDIGSYETTIMQLGISAIVLIPYLILTEDFKAMQISGQSILLLLVAGIVHTGIAYALYFGAMKGMKAQTAAIFSYIDPVVAILISIVLLREETTILTIVGAILVLGAAAISERLPKKKEES